MVAGVELLLLPGGVMPGIPDWPGGHRWAGAGHGKPPYGGGGYSP